MSLIDWILLFGLLLSTLVGAWRGLLKEVMSLLGWVVAYFCAQWFGAAGARMVPIGEAGSRLNVAAGVVFVFVVTWVVWALLSWALSQVLKASSLSGADRVLGAGFGAMRGVFVALVVCTLVGMTPISRWELWRASTGVHWLEVFLTGLMPVLPEQVIKFLPEQS